MSQLDIYGEFDGANHLEYTTDINAFPRNERLFYYHTKEHRVFWHVQRSSLINHCYSVAEISFVKLRFLLAFAFPYTSNSLIILVLSTPTSSNTPLAWPNSP